MTEEDKRNPAYRRMRRKFWTVFVVGATVGLGGSIGITLAIKALGGGIYAVVFGLGWFATIPFYTFWRGRYWMKPDMVEWWAWRKEHLHAVNRKDSEK